MSTLTETTHAGGFLVAEGPGDLSRENIVVVSGQDLAAGAVLGQITTGGKYRAVQPGASDGSEVAAGVLYDAVDATAGDVRGVVVVRVATVNASELVWPSGTTDNQKATALSELATVTGSRGFVIARTGVGG
jgi:hypothetical protein